MRVAGSQVRSRRVFFALWPDESQRAAAAARAAELLPPGTGQPRRPDQWHVTLVFLGAVPESRLAEVQSVAAAVRSEPVALELDQLEYWRAPRVLCLAASVVPPTLAQLVADLRQALAVSALPGESRPYRPHLTLARKLARFDAARPVDPLPWHADSFALVESRSGPAGALYLPLSSWLLAGGAASGAAPRNG